MSETGGFAHRGPICTWPIWTVWACKIASKNKPKKWASCNTCLDAREMICVRFIPCASRMLRKYTPRMFYARSSRMRRRDRFFFYANPRENRRDDASVHQDQRGEVYIHGNRSCVSSERQTAHFSWCSSFLTRLGTLWLPSKSIWPLLYQIKVYLD